MKTGIKMPHYADKTPTPIRVGELIHRAELNVPFVVLARDMAHAHQLMRTAKSYQGRLGVKLDTKAAQVWIVYGEEDYLHRAVMVTVKSKAE